MNNDLIVSIITPSFNHVSFIADTLSSIFSQTGPFYIDLIVVDGASTDGTAEYVMSKHAELVSSALVFQKNGLEFFKSSDVKCNGISFRWKSEKDSGQADAINKGFFQAKGDIMCWLNSDDFYSSDRTLELVTNFFRSFPDEQFVYGKGLTLNKAGEVVGEESYVLDSSKENINEIDYILQPAAFWTRRVYQEFGNLDEKYHFVLDWDYWVRISKKYKLNYIDEYLACNRIYPQTKTASGSSKRYIEILKFLAQNNSLTEKSLNAYVTGPEIHKELMQGNIVLRYLFIFSRKARKEGFYSAVQKSVEQIKIIWRNIRIKKKNKKLLS